MNTYGIDFHAAKIQTFLERAAFFLKKVYMGISLTIVTVRDKPAGW